VVPAIRRIAEQSSLCLECSMSNDLMTNALAQRR
jgi:hypothetical protein